MSEIQKSRTVSDGGQAWLPLLSGVGPGCPHGPGPVEGLQPEGMQQPDWLLEGSVKQIGSFGILTGGASSRQPA